MESGETADLIVRESIQLTEASIKLLAAGSKNLTAFLWALSKDNKKVKGKTSLGRLLKEEKELKMFRIKTDDLKSFSKLGKQYGVLYAAVKNKKFHDGTIDLITNVDYVPQVNRIIERLGYVAPAKAQEENAEKKADPRAQPVNSSPERENGLKASRTETTAEKPSVKGRLAALRSASEDMRPRTVVPQRSRSATVKTR